MVSLLGEHKGHAVLCWCSDKVGSAGLPCCCTLSPSTWDPICGPPVHQPLCEPCSWSLASRNEEAHEFLRRRVDAFCCWRHLCSFRGFCSRGAWPSLLAWCLIRHPWSWRICHGRGFWSICGPSLHRHDCLIQPDVVPPCSLRRCSLAAVVKPTASLLSARLHLTAE